MQERRSKPRRRLIVTGAAALALAAGIGYRVARDGRASAEKSATTAPAEADADASASNASSPRADISAGRHTRPAPPLRAAASLPPSGTPLVQIYDDLKARADAGDAQAASRLYHDVGRCQAAAKSRKAIAQMLPNALEGDLKNASTKTLKTQENTLNQIQEHLEFIQKTNALCTGLSNSQLDSLVPLSLRAAQLGDLGALNCYVGSDFVSMPGLLDHPEWLTQYRQNAPDLIDAAIHNGDWVAVELAHHAYAGVFSDSPRGQLIHADPVMDYRYLQLERLGASGDFVKKLERMIAEAGEQLTDQQKAQARAGAQDDYAHYFNGSSSNEVFNGANICGSFDD